jgi:maltooligosyltrehalose trehalohydrolase
VIYELHVGTFTGAGTFDAIIAELPHLHELGITAIELMPVAEFPGNRNWGYDGVFPFAAHGAYGGPLALKRLIDACHRAGIAVVLDVVYNHLGPEGNCLPAFGFYCSDRHRTPWGAAMNLDGAHSDEVRTYFIQNALQWILEFRVDALRIDAVHAMFDGSARPFLAELADVVHETARAHGRHAFLIAESDLGDPRVIRAAERGGYGLDAQWLDDFHHALHTTLTGERAGYYRDFGRLDQLADAFRHGFVYRGQYSRHRHRRHGAPAPDARPDQFVVFTQNHDQIGNRLAGDRLAATLSLEPLKLAAATVLLSPFVPLLFMGEEYGEPAPFPYFVSHSEPELREAVRRGRAAEFAAFDWLGEPPDPCAEETFLSAKIDRSLRHAGQRAALYQLHRRLIALRRELPLLTSFTSLVARTDHELLAVLRHDPHVTALLALNVSAESAALRVPPAAAPWRIALDTADTRWAGPGAGTLAPDGTLTLQPHAAVLLVANA